MRSNSQKRMTAFERAAHAFIENHPTYSLERCCMELLTFPGASIEKVKAIVQEYEDEYPYG